ncbi:MAG: PAS domain S-box protein [Spirochaetales bacterium]|nr:PAS domain S-box protein [Spirochaetales bacterium]
MSTLVFIKISLAAVRLLGMFAILDLYYSKKRNPVLLIVAIGWFVYAISPLAFVYSTTVSKLYYLPGISGLLGTYLIFAGIISYFVKINKKRIWQGAGLIVFYVFVISYGGFSTTVSHISVILGQLIILFSTSILGIIRWKKYHNIASTGTLWLIAVLVTGILLCIGYLSFPGKDTPVIFGVFHLIISISVIIYFLNMEYNISFYETKEHEGRLNAIFNSSPNAIVITSITGEIISCNPAALDMYRVFTDKDILGKNVKEIFLSTEEVSLEKYREKLLKEGLVKDVEFTGIDITGREFPVRISTGIVKNYKIKPEFLVTIARDISNEIAAERKFQYSLKEKDILLEEINSRVKNNLTLISSLLGLQLIDNENTEIEEIIIKSQHRINSMALIHEKLYESKNFNDIDFEGYIDRLINYLLDDYGHIGEHINYELQISKINMDLENLIPFGLILNEIITNSLVHGFEKTSDPLIKVGLKIENGIINLSLCDNGSGIPDLNILKSKHSLGLMIIESLTDQLHGEYKVDGQSGTCWEFLFPEKRN